LFLYYQWFFQNIELGWKKIFEIRLFPQFLKMMKFTKKNPLAFFNILKEPLLVQKQTIPQKKVLVLSFFVAGKFKSVALSGGHHAPLPQKHILLNFMGRGGFTSIMGTLGPLRKLEDFFDVISPREEES
jgi:hypothetical protein